MSDDERISLNTKRLVLIDGSSYLYRAFYALPMFRTQQGFPTQAIYGFTGMLLKVRKELEPDFLAVCFDHSAPTLRKQAYEFYKATRPGMPKELSVQVPKVFEVIQAFGVPMLIKEGLEADDLIAGVAERFKGLPGVCIAIVSQDKDLLQLLDANVCLLDTMRNKKTTLESFKEAYGIEPRLFGDCLALMGDASDNIPGVPGIGAKGALALIKRYGSIDALLERLEELPPKKRDQILAGRESLELSRSLVRLKTDGTNQVRLEDLAPRPPDNHALYELFCGLEFRRFIDDLGLAPEDKACPRGTTQTQEILGKVLELGLRTPLLEVLYSKHPPFAFDIEGVAIGDERRVALWDTETPLAAFFGSDPVWVEGVDLKPKLVALASRGVQNLFPGFDLALASYLLDPNRRNHGFEALVERFLGGGTQPPPRGALSERIAIAARIRPKLAEALELRPRLKALLEEVELPLVEVLVRMERVGIEVDLKALHTLSARYASQLEALQERAHVLAGERFNLNSPKQLQAILFDKLGLPSYKRTKTGLSTDVEVLESLKGQHELIDVLLDYRILAKLKGTYLDPLPELVDPETLRVHSSFNQMATATGRLSSSEPNLQNLPVRGERGEEIRNVFVAKEGHVFVAFDYAQVELKLLAHLSQDERLIQAFLDNQDIHAQTASLVFGVPKENVDSALRRRAKVINFGILYGMTPYGLSKELRIGQEEAKTFIENYFAAFPRVKGFLDGIVAQAEHDGVVETLLGRIRPTPGIKHGSASLREQAKREAINAPIQGSASDLIKKAMVDGFRLIQDEGLDAELVLQIHDELLFEVAERSLEAFVPKVRRAMEHAIELCVPLQVDVRWGKAYGRLRDLKQDL